MRVEILRSTLYDDEVQIKTNAGSVLATFDETKMDYPRLLEWMRDFLQAMDAQYPIMFDAVAKKVRL